MFFGNSRFNENFSSVGRLENGKLGPVSIFVAEVVCMPISMCKCAEAEFLHTLWNMVQINLH